MEKMKYTFGKSTDMSFDEALDKLPGLLKEEGFGVLTEIDVKETLKKKLQTLKIKKSLRNQKQKPKIAVND